MMVWGGMTSQHVTMTGVLSSPPKAKVTGLRHGGIPGNSVALVHDSAGPSHLHDRRSGGSMIDVDSLTDISHSVSGLEDSDCCCDCPCNAGRTTAGKVSEKVVSKPSTPLPP
ncbi:hypothetical protein RRG08_038737 [Elysia crispata]|uniref:Uncharacterized protein n=1 Tax=Elysia crispata TaxID=231223 RepID=A0AAE0Y913_9GAST|nr:hypothetical protein RRG08_038737 [Elysia crispata]